MRETQMSREENIAAHAHCHDLLAARAFDRLREVFAANEVDALSADEDYGTMVYRLSGTHQGDYMGIPPTGKHFEVRGLQVGRFENSVIAERWGSSDSLGILSQLGISAKAV
jgi:SnoaL-like polyketide cyclase